MVVNSKHIPGSRAARFTFFNFQNNRMKYVSSAPHPHTRTLPAEDAGALKIKPVPQVCPVRKPKAENRAAGWSDPAPLSPQRHTGPDVALQLRSKSSMRRGDENDRRQTYAVRPVSTPGDDTWAAGHPEDAGDPQTRKLRKGREYA